MSLAATVAVGALFGTIAGRVVEDYAYRERAHTIAYYVSEFLAPRLTSQDFLGESRAARIQFEFAMRTLVGRAGIQRITVWSRDGRILYSDDRGVIGLQGFFTSPQLGLALNGRETWERVPAASGTLKSPERLEVFVPVFVPQAREPVAVYDVVSQLSGLSLAIAQLRRSVWISIVLGILVLYSMLFSIVHQAARRLVRQELDLRRALLGAIRSLANAVDARDLATGNHSSRVAQYAEEIARAMRLDAALVRDAQSAGYLHDLGKIGVPDAILTKRGPLTKAEWIMVMRHSVAGYEILRPVPLPERVKLAVRHSHECWDGTGYPDALAGERIPLLARIVAVADAYEALTTARPYRPAGSAPEAIEEIRRCRGSQFDPRVVDALLAIWPEWVAQADHPPDEVAPGSDSILQQKPKQREEAQELHRAG